MFEKSKTQWENPQTIKAETIPNEGISLRHHEVVYVASDFTNEATFFLGHRRQPGKFSRVVTIRLGDEKIHDDIEMLAVPSIDGIYGSPTFYAYAVNPKRPDQVPVPIFDIYDSKDDEVGVIGKETKPERTDKPTVSYKHVRVFSEGDLLGIENLEPQYSTTLLGVQPLGQQSFPNLIPEVKNLI